MGNCNVKFFCCFLVFLVVCCDMTSLSEELKRHAESSRSVRTNLFAQMGSFHGLLTRDCVVFCVICLWACKLDACSLTACVCAQLLVHESFSDTAKWGVVRTFKIIPFSKSCANAL